jgi:hypothetical protein
LKKALTKRFVTGQVEEKLSIQLIRLRVVRLGFSCLNTPLFVHVQIFSVYSDSYSH